jgi:phytoene dehydrogenase-like protein
LNQLENLRPFAPLFFIAFGLQKGIIHLPPTILGYTIELQTPILSAPNMSVSRLQLHSLAHDSTLAPEGYFLLTLVLPTEFTYWQLLRQNDIVEYEKQKQKIITQVILALENRFPGFASCLVFANAATPATYWRYTYNFQGSYAGWVPTPLALNQYFSRTVEGLENVYIAGHWLQSGGGLPPAVVSARNAVQCICAQEKIPFTLKITTNK